MFEIIFTPKNRSTIFAIAGGKNPKTSFLEMGFTDEQLKTFLEKEEYLAYLECKTLEYWGSLPLFSSLYSLFSEDKPLILFTAEGGECDTCLEIFLKYGNGQRPNLDELFDMRTCMDDYNGDINAAVKKVEKLMEIMFPENLYEFEHCSGVMGDIHGNFTWDRYQNHNYLPCASPWTHVHMNINGLEAPEQAFIIGSKKKKSNTVCHSLKTICLVPSQPAEAFSEERVEFYRQQIRNGKRLGCIAFEIEHISNYAIILDGHHRVLASMLEGVFPDCLVISEANYRIVTKKEQTFLKLPPHLYDNRKKTGIQDLQEDVMEFLRNNKIVKKHLSEEEKLKYYKYYRSNTKNDKAYFEKKYETAAKNMIDKVFADDCV